MVFKVLVVQYLKRPRSGGEGPSVRVAALFCVVLAMQGVVIVPFCVPAYKDGDYAPDKAASDYRGMPLSQY